MEWRHAPRNSGLEGSGWSGSPPTDRRQWEFGGEGKGKMAISWKVMIALDRMTLGISNSGNGSCME